jgi:hypothetical protein
MISDKIHAASHKKFYESSYKDLAPEFTEIIENTKRKKFIVFNTPFHLENKSDDVFSQQYYFRDGGMLTDLEPYLKEIRAGDIKVVLFFTDWWGFCNWREINGTLNNSNLVSYDIYNWVYEHFKNLDILSNSVFVSPVSTMYTKQHSDWPIVEFNEPFNRFMDVAKTLPNLKQVTGIPKQFDNFLFSLNRRPRSHRIYTFYKLYQAGLLNDSKFTFHYFDELVDNESKKLEHFTDALEQFNEDNIDFDFFNSINGKQLDIAYDVINDIQYINEIETLNLSAASCFLEIVNEYNCSNKKVFLSEKIARSIILRNPFVVLGDRGSLLTLQRNGFRTFSNVWDESYDLLPTFKERADAAVNLIETEINDCYIKNKRYYPDDIWDIVTYNYNWYFNGYKQQQIEKFKRIFE